MWFYPTDIDAAENVQAIVKGVSRRRIEAAWTRIDNHLAGGGPYLLGDAFSAADLMLLMLMRWSRNMPKPVTEWPTLARYAALMRARPSWKRLYEI
jgi:glutathione S-transferase